MASFFVSDLHLFSSRSKAHEHMVEIHEAAATGEHLILGGDIFDFRWASCGEDVAIDAAVEWLQTLLAESDTCRIHYVLGNHDHHHKLLPRLAELADALDRFQWHEAYVRIDSSVFLHGDVAERKMTAGQLHALRARWAEKHAPRPVWLNHLYDLVVASRIHRALPLIFHPPRLIAERLLHYLSEIGEGPKTGLQHVYFGHTHSEMTDYRYGGVMFHNCGATIHGLNFRVVKTRL